MRTATELAFVAGLLTWTGVSFGWIHDVAALGLVFVLAQLVVALRIVISVESGALSRRYLAGYVERPVRFEPAEAVAPPPAVVADLEHLGFLHAASVVEPDSGSTFHLLAAPSGLVIASVAHRSGSVAYLSKSASGRILQTTPLVVPPSSFMVVCTAPGADPRRLLQAHLELVHRLQARGERFVPTVPTTVFARAAELEQQAYGALGPVVGALLDLECRRRVLQPTLRVSPSDLIALAEPDRADRAGLPPGTAPQAPGEPRTAHAAVGYAQP